MPNISSDYAKNKAMKSKKARRFINDRLSIGSLTFIAADVEYCVTCAEQEAEERIRRELTRWHDPKEELPEYAEVVEVKYKAFGKIMMAVAWRLGCSDSGEDVWYIDGTLKRIDPEAIIGWREIHE